MKKNSTGGAKSSTYFLHQRQNKLLFTLQLPCHLCGYTDPRALRVMGDAPEGIKTGSVMYSAYVLANPGQFKVICENCYTIQEKENPTYGTE